MLNNLISEIYDVYEIMFNDILWPDRPQITVWHMRFSYRMWSVCV